MARPKMIRLAEGEPPRLALRLENRVVHIAVDGADAGELRDLPSTKGKWETTLDDGRKVEVRLLRPVLMPELAVLVDGRHAVDSPSHPARMLRGPAQGLLAGGAIFLLRGLIGRGGFDAVAVVLESLQVVGALLMLRRKYAGVALVATAQAADIALITLQAFMAPLRSLIWPAATRLLMLVFLWRSFVALRDLHDAESDRPGTLPPVSA